MQKAISNKIELGDILNPLHDYAAIPSINDDGTLENLIGKVDKACGFISTGKADGDLARYFPNILPVTRQAEVAGEVPRKAYASVTYTDKKQLEFLLDLTANTYRNFSTMEICLPLWFTKKSNKNLHMDRQMITVNNFFVHWFTDIDIRWYPDDMSLLPTNNSVAIHHYSNAQMKYLPEKAVKNFWKRCCILRSWFILKKNNDRRPHNDNDDAGRTDPNLTYCIAQLKNYIFQKHIYRIPLGSIVDLVLVNFAFKTDLRIVITLERNLNKLFESNKKVTTVPENPDAFINIYDRPFISYQEINLTKNADLYFTGILRSETALRQGVLPAQYQQEFEVDVGT